jgi:hypothetical protein
VQWRRWWTATVALCALVTAVAVGLGSAAPAYAIAHGRDAAEGEYPFATKLTMLGIPDGSGGRRDSSCSGGLIAPRWVLTAGHCFKNSRGAHVSRPVARKTVATVGRADLTGSGGAEATVIKVYQSKVNDVALAQLDRKITGITPMRVSRRAPQVGQALRLTGFGLLNGDDEEVTDRMQVGQFAVTSVTRYELGVAGTAPSRQTSACEHDSGGPYFVPDGTSAVVYGVVSYGPDCPHSGSERSARIDTIASWALGIIGRDGPAPTPTPTAKPFAAPSVTPSPAASRPPAAALPETDKTATRLPYGLSTPVLAGAPAVLVGIALLAGARRRKRWRPRHRR